MLNETLNNGTWPFEECTDYEMLATGTSGLNIQRKLITKNFNTKSSRSIKYIVIHYMANFNGKAASLYNVFQNGTSSAHYGVGSDGIFQVVEDKNVAWHCGGELYSKSKKYGGASLNGKCTNNNSIGIEVASISPYSDYLGPYTFADGTIDTLVKLVKYLMDKYNIDVDHVCRHYDTTGKACPAPMVPSAYLKESKMRVASAHNDFAWENFKARLVEPKVQEHWTKQYFDFFKKNGYISNDEIWTDYDGYMTKAEGIALLDKITGGIWTSAETNASIHWVQPHVISMCGKKYIDATTKDEIWLTNPDGYISKAQVLALIDNMTGGMMTKYINASVDHWARKNLNSLCDKVIIDTPQAWDNDFEAPITRGTFMAIVTKAINSNMIV